MNNEGAITPRIKVIAYIDGFGLFYGLRKGGLIKGLSEYSWLDMKALVRSLLSKRHDVVEIKYYTSRIHKRYNNKQIRDQENLHCIISASPRISLFYGESSPRVMECPSCNKTWLQDKQKKTDVKMAVAIILDALDNKYGTALIISGDSDLVPAINAVMNRRDKRFRRNILIAFPPSRETEDMKVLGCCFKTITKANLRHYRIGASAYEGTDKIRVIIDAS